DRGRGDSRRRGRGLPVPRTHAHKGLFRALATRPKIFRFHHPAGSCMNASAAAIPLTAAETAPPLATYNDKVVRQFAIMTVVWGIVGMLVGVIIAAQLFWPELNFGPWLSYGRLRPLHTNAGIFAFGGSALFATSHYVAQRTCHTPLFAPKLATFTFWGWQAIIVLAAITLPLGYTAGKEYAELEWPIDVLIAIVWVSYAIVFLGTLVKRRVSHIFVANWFF